MTTSSIPLVKERLLSLFDEDDNLAAVQRLYGIGALNGTADKIHVALGDTADWSREWEDLGAAKTITESYGLNLYIRVEREGDSQQEATEQTFTILEALDNLMKRSSTAEALQPYGVWEVGLTPSDLVEIPTTEGFNAYITAVISVKSQI